MFFVHAQEKGVDSKEEVLTQSEGKTINTYKMGPAGCCLALG